MIFVEEMGDIMGEWVSDELIGLFLSRVEETPQHIVQVLTKNPKRLADFNPWPKNCWVGATVENEQAADSRIPYVLQTQASVRFVSFEPILGEISVAEDLGPGVWTKREPEKENSGYIKTRGLDWIIAGAQTQPSKLPQRVQLEQITREADAAGVPVFLKNNLQPLFPGEKLRQDFPAQVGGLK